MTPTLILSISNGNNLKMRFGMIKLPNSLRIPSPWVGWHRKIRNRLQAGAKYAWVGVALSMGAEGVSALVNHAEGP